MIFILAVCVISMGASLLLVFPLLRDRTSPPQTDWRSFDRAVYQDQLGEIYADRAQGLMSEAEAEAARIEIARRLLSTQAPAAPAPQLDEDEPFPVEDEVSSARDRLSPRVALCLVAVVCVGAFFLYLLGLGSPGFPDVPYAQRLGQATGPQVSSALKDEIAKTRQAIEHDTYNPGLRMTLAFLLKDAGKGDEARFQAGEAARLAPTDPTILSDYAVVVILVDGGIVSRQAHDIAMKTLDLDRTQQTPRAFLGFEREQGGDMNGALAIWKDLRPEVQDGTDLAGLLDRKLAEGSVLAGVDLTTLEPRHPLDFAPESWDALDSPPGAEPSASTRRVGTVGPALARMLPPVEQAALEANVDIVTNRLAETPRDFDLWMNLARTQRVLGNFDAALTAYQTGMDIEPKDMEARRGAAFVQVAKAESQGEEVAPKAAYDLLRGIVRDNPDDAEALYHLGVEAAHGGDTARARELWSQVLVLIGPDAPPSSQVRAKLEALGSP